MLERVVSTLGGWGLRSRPGTRVVRAIAAITAVLTALAVIVVIGWNNRYATDKIRLLSGAAWLLSSREGLLTLVDGSSATIAAQVTVAEPDHQLSVAQYGTTAYVIDHTVGSIRRIDGGTFQPTESVTPIPGAQEGLRGFASSDALYVLDTERGIHTQLDPMTLAIRSGPLPIADQVGERAAILDEAGRLWVLDVASGDLTWIRDGQPSTRQKATQPHPGKLALAGGVPVLIDTQTLTASILDPETGDTENTTKLDTNPGDTIQVGDSPHAHRLHMTSRGALTVCDLTSTSCENAIPLNDAEAKKYAGADLGPPIETRDRVFVPDYTNGWVWIVDPGENPIVIEVFSPPAPFELLIRDGIVFFNDPNSDKAGIIHPDGKVIPVSKKYPEPPAGTTQIPIYSTFSPPPKTTGRQPPLPSTIPPEPGGNTSDPSASTQFTITRTQPSYPPNTTPNTSGGPLSPSSTSTSPSPSSTSTSPPTSTTTASRTFPSSADGKFRADTVQENGVHYRIVEVATERTVLTTDARFDEANDVKAGRYCDDGSFLAAYHYGHGGNHTWIGAWSLESGQFLDWTRIEGHTRDLSDNC